VIRMKISNFPNYSDGLTKRPSENPIKN